MSPSELDTLLSKIAKGAKSLNREIDTIGAAIESVESRLAQADAGTTAEILLKEEELPATRDDENGRVLRRVEQNFLCYGRLPQQPGRWGFYCDRRDLQQTPDEEWALLGCDRSFRDSWSRETRALVLAQMPRMLQTIEREITSKLKSVRNAKSVLKDK